MVIQTAKHINPYHPNCFISIHIHSNVIYQSILILFYIHPYHPNCFISIHHSSKVPNCYISFITHPNCYKYISIHAHPQCYIWSITHPNVKREQKQKKKKPKGTFFFVCLLFWIICVQLVLISFVCAIYFFFFIVCICSMSLIVFFNGCNIFILIACIQQSIYIIRHLSLSTLFFFLYELYR